MNKLKWLHAAMLAAVALLCSCAGEKQKELLPVVSSSEAKSQASTAELRDLYKAAKSERERRAIALRDMALRAIDEGVIQTFGPVKISTVDAIFSTHLASELPTKKQVTRTGIVDLSGRGSPGKNESGWFLAVEYDYSGSINRYYLTNIHQ